MRKTIKIVVMTAIVLLTVGSVNAQVTIGISEMPSKYSVLDLKQRADGTSTKGFHLPRMTEAQRDALIVTATDSTDARGVRIYNLDEDCENFWNGKEWISLCQGSSNPEVDIPVSECNRIRVYGQYYKSAPLNNAHYIIVPVTVTKKGNYTIIVNSNNGYYFQTSGVFNDVGSFELRLDGMGTPAQNGTDTLVITCNGSIIGSSCTVKVNVGALTMGYQTDCDSIKVMGSYQTRKFMDSNDNYVTVPIDVMLDGQAAFETNVVNNIKFTCSQGIVSGPDTLILRAQGSPKQAGKFTFTFTTNGSIKTTCSFEVTFISTLGEFSDPACKCLDIYDENPMADNGEYWLLDCIAGSSDAVKTFCDIKNGGWTLVWSYNEQTAYANYGTANTMVVPGNTYGVSINQPLNRVVVEGGAINYANFRLNRTEWQHFPNSTSRPQIKVRIADDPRDMDDAWALNNYGIISPQSTAQNPIETNFSDYRVHVPAEGKIYGKKWLVSAGGSYDGGWDEVTNGYRAYMRLYNSATYCTHWDFGNNQGSTTQFQVVPNPGNSAANNTISMSNINNAFGWFGETQPNHHFGKCGGASGDNYSFTSTTRTCGSGTGASDLKPHTHQVGGRYLQWFVR